MPQQWEINRDELTAKVVHAMLTNSMTGELWSTLPPAIREQCRDNSSLTPQLIGLEGCRVEVVDDAGEKPHRFIVGKSSGWKPIHLEMPTSNAHGRGSAAKKYASVRFIERIR